MPKSSSIGECYQIWKKENQNSLNPLTFHRYNNLLQRHLIPQFFNTPAEDITEHEIDCFVSKKQEENMSEVTLDLNILSESGQEKEVSKLWRKKNRICWIL